MLTLINKNKKLYNWTLNIVILFTMFISIINVFFIEFNQQLFLSIYSVPFLIYIVMVILLWILHYKEKNIFNWYEWLWIIFYLIDLIYFVISFIFCCMQFQIPVYILGGMIFSVVRLVFFNLNWNFINR